MEARFTIGRVLALAWRACLACRWHILLIGTPTAIAAVGARWLTSPIIAEHVSPAWQWMATLWQGVLVQCIAYVAVTFAVLSYMAGQRQSARNVLRFPWRRLPAVLITGLILQLLTWWPEPLLEWNEEEGGRLVIVYTVLTTNVLAFDLLTFVWLPILVAEKGSMMTAFRRSAWFAKQHPWRILSIDVGFWFVYLLFNEAVMFLYPRIDPGWANLTWSALIAAWTLLSLSASCCLSVVTYHLIRSEQEGLAPETLAQVFD